MQMRMHNRMKTAELKCGVSADGFRETTGFGSHEPLSAAEAARAKKKKGWMLHSLACGAADEIGLRQRCSIALFCEIMMVLLTIHICLKTRRSSRVPIMTAVVGKPLILVGPCGADQHTAWRRSWPVAAAGCQLWPPRFSLVLTHPANAGSG